VAINNSFLPNPSNAHQNKQHPKMITALTQLQIAVASSYRQVKASD
jgi:hypothetical protein